MGQAKNQLIDQQENIRECPECGESVRVNWSESPNFGCTNCEYVDDVADCEICGAAIPKDGMPVCDWHMED